VVLVTGAMVAVQADVERNGGEGSVVISHEVCLNSADSTLDVFFSSNGVVSSLSKGIFGSLLSAVRADTGVKEGRYFFEVQVLEHFAQPELRVGFSTDRSPLLGQFSENVSFDAQGSFITCQPGRVSEEILEVCKPFGQQLVGVLIELNKDGASQGMVSVFLDGQRAGSPQSLPPSMCSKALFPTLIFQNLTLAVSLGRLARYPLDGCRPFGSLLEKDHVPSSLRRTTPRELVIPVALPNVGLHDYAQRLREEKPDYVELGDQMIEEWCLASGLHRSREPGPEHSRDTPDLGAFSEDAPKSRRAFHELARVSGRSVVHTSVRSGLLEAERRAMLQFLPDAKKIAVVLFGQPSADFREWVKRRRRALHEAKKVEAEVRGEKPPEDLDLPDASQDDVSVLLRSDVPDLTEQSLDAFASFSLPSTAEGFDEIRYEWAGQEASQEALLTWQRQRKASHVVAGLRPGAWFQAKLKAWKELKQSLQRKQKDWSNRVAADPTLKDLAAEIQLGDVKSIQDVHDIDGKGTPLYALFKYEDWVVFSWRYELHLLCQAFLIDAADPEREGIPEVHVEHYWKIYFHHHFEPRKLGAASLDAALKVLKEPLRLVDAESGPRLLQSTLDKETPFEVFVASVEAYRRDRTRRIEAGDESANLVMPKKTAPKGGPPAQPPANKVAAKAAPNAPGKAPAKAVAKTPAKAKPREPSSPPPKSVQPGAARSEKAPDKVSVTTVTVAKVPQKRSLPTASLPPPKRVKPIGAASQGRPAHVAKVSVAKRPPPGR